MTTPNRFSRIIDFAYDRLRGKINGGGIAVANEASLQLQLAAILKTVGELFEVHPKDRFSIELEKPMRLSGGIFNKSGSTDAKIDIFLSFYDALTDLEEHCAIELKFFKRDNFAQPRKRYALFQDIQNIESYEADIGYLIVATDHEHFVNHKGYSAATGDFDARQGRRYTAGTTLTYHSTGDALAPIRLQGSYEFSWDECASGLHFMKLLVQTTKRPDATAKGGG